MMNPSELFLLFGPPVLVGIGAIVMWRRRILREQVLAARAARNPSGSLSEKELENRTTAEFIASMKLVAEGAATSARASEASAEAARQAALTSGSVMMSQGVGFTIGPLRSVGSRTAEQYDLIDLSSLSARNRNPDGQPHP